MKRLQFTTFFSLFLLLIFSLNAQVKKRGIPAITNFRTAEFGTGAQNWGVLQDQRGIMYFANSKGLLAFDGERWELTTLPNKSGVRSLAIDENGRIYVGAQGEMGYLEVGKNGRLEYASFLSDVPEKNRSFAGVPNIHVLNRGVFFHTLKQSFFWKNGVFKIFETDNLYQLSFKIGEEVYLNETGKGLLQLSNGNLKPVTRGTFFADKRIELILPFGEGKILISTEKEGLFLGDFNDVEPSFEPFSTNSAQFFKQNPPYCGVALSGGFYALGTHQSGLVIIDSVGNPIQHLHEGNGLQNNLIWGMNIDEAGNLWLALDDGISHISLNSPFSSFSTEGSVLATAIEKEQLYVGTTQGVFTSSWAGYQNPLEKASGFQPIPNTKEQAWSFKKTDFGLLCAHISGVFELDGTRSRKISKDYTWKLASFPDSPKLLLAGTYNNGLALLRAKKGKWEVANKLKGFEESSRYLAIESRERIWVSHPLNGVFLLTPNKELNEIVTVKKFGVENGLPADSYNFVFKMYGKIVFGTENGIYKFDLESQKFVKDEWFVPLYKVRKLEEGLHGEIWFLADGKVGTLRENSQGIYQIEHNNFAKLAETDIYDISVADSHNVFFGTPNGLIHYNPAFEQKAGETKVFQTHIRNLKTTRLDSTLFHGNFAQKNGMVSQTQTEVSAWELPYKLNDLRFEYSATWFGDSEELEYQYFLEGNDNEWSPWSGKSEKDYTNLSEGDYTFHVRARNSIQQVGQEASLIFSVSPPWYRTWWAILVWICLITILVWLGVRLYTKRLESEKRRLEDLVQERTVEINTQKLEIEAQNSNLTNLNQEKSDLMGVLAHDLRNPLHQVKGLTDIIGMSLGKVDEKDIREYLGKIHGSISHLNNMITKILDLEAIESKKTNVVLEKTDLRHLLRMIADSFSGRAMDKNITLIQNIQDKPQFVEIDKTFGSQVFENLLSNAIKFSPTDKNIYINLVEKEGEFRAEIRDEGPGMSKEDMSKLFGKFQKLSARPTAGEKSTGLGLSIVKKYVEVMNGKVWCESELGEGASFVVEFEKVG
ncbi:MAG: signal transduction histidine kinase/ligand-binding sensor domain-containing protein [Bacteroidia bacterium]|jgi:signal transduction histidine kinase/ligand-binding sensor domain-containing protein